MSFLRFVSLSLLVAACGDSSVVDLGAHDAGSRDGSSGSGSTSNATTGSSGASTTSTGGSGGSGQGGGSTGSTTGAAGSSGSSGGVTSSGGGSSGAGGRSGSGGGGGASGGSAGQGGSAGTAGTAGASGAGGGPIGPSQPECMTTADCRLHSDCCTCQALPKGEPAPACADTTCGMTKCQQMPLPSSAGLACIAGRCVVGFECDGTMVTCQTQRPACAPGSIASVVNGCWGACVPVTECRTVGACSDCGTYGCAVHVLRTGAQNHCVTVPASCGAGANCACLGPSVCVGMFNSCAELPGSRGVQCSCPTCS